VLSNNLTISNQEQAEVIDKISKLLKEEYIDSTVAEKSSAFIQKQFKAGAYERLEDNKISQLRKSVIDFLKAEKELKFEDARKLIYKQLESLVKSFDLDESALNDMGYRYLQLHQNPTVATIVFEYNTEKHPTSYNVWGSLADSYLENGQIKLAVNNYKKALSIEPEDKYSLARLEDIKQSYKKNN